MVASGFVTGSMNSRGQARNIFGKIFTRGGPNADTSHEKQARGVTLCGSRTKGTRSRRGVAPGRQVRALKSGGYTLAQVEGRDRARRECRRPYSQ